MDGVVLLKQIEITIAASLSAEGLIDQPLRILLGSLPNFIISKFLKSSRHYGHPIFQVSIFTDVVLVEELLVSGARLRDPFNHLLQVQHGCSFLINNIVAKSSGIGFINQRNQGWGAGARAGRSRVFLAPWSRSRLKKKTWSRSRLEKKSGA